ncbi:MAG: restriction system protein [Paracoccaceae bacterium]|jgi:restriction system protein
MPVPDYQTMMRPVLLGFSQGAKNVKETLPTVISQLNLTPQDAEELLPSGKKTLLSDRAHWARTYMSKAGLIQTVKRNHHEITSSGKAFLERHPGKIDNGALSEIESFTDWVAAAAKMPRNSKATTADNELTVLATPEKTPEDQISTAFSEIKSVLADEIIEAVLSLSTARFERLVVHLLLAMGYGGGDLERGLQTNLSGDGGIDGIINEDELGLDAVYIQAKRYAPENNVGRPALNAFVGSLTGEGATKGVFVTTSDYSSHAREYVSRVQQRIVLINGQDLARLMIKHEVGVRARETYVLRSVDEDYFSDV